MNPSDRASVNKQRSEGHEHPLPSQRQVDMSTERSATGVPRRHQDRPCAAPLGCTSEILRVSLGAAHQGVPQPRVASIGCSAPGAYARGTSQRAIATPDEATPQTAHRYPSPEVTGGATVRT